MKNVWIRKSALRQRRAFKRVRQAGRKINATSAVSSRDLPSMGRVPIPLKHMKRMSGIRNMLTFGRVRRPSQIVVMLHGLNDTAECCSHPVVTSWQKGLPQALIVVPEACDMTSWADEEDPGYDWVRTKHPPPWETFKKHGSGSSLYEDSLKEYQRVLRKRCRQLNMWLDTLLAKYGLTDQDVVLAGFSLGAYLSAMIGSQRNVRGIIVCGGMCTTQEVRFHELMPKTSSARFLAVNGTKDSLVKRLQLECVLKNFHCEWHWSKGVGHDFPAEWYRIALKWMRILFRAKSR